MWGTYSLFEGTVMIAGIGTDIIEVGRIRQAVERRGGFVQRVFTPVEAAYCLSKSNWAERFAGRFAAKEAVAKCLGLSLCWHDVEILSDQTGRPIVALTNRAAAVAAGRTVLLSISHCRSHAVAYAALVSG